MPSAIQTARAQPREDDHSETRGLRLEHLPVELCIIIFSYLTARDLCAAGQTCRAWRALADCHVTWEKLLRDALPKWEAVSHTGVPSHQRLLMCPRESYLQIAASASEVSSSAQLSSSSSKPTPVILFGRGLETHGDHLVNKFFWDENTPLSVVGMSPGIGGIGSGVQVDFPGEHGSAKRLNIITLYQKTAAERRRRDNTPGRLIEPTGISALTQQLCKTAGAFVYVLDPTLLQSPETRDDEIENILFELSELLDKRWTSPSTPLLLFSCAPTLAPAPPLLDIVYMLHLPSLRRPWQIRKLPVEAWQSAMSKGLSWLFPAGSR